MNEPMAAPTIARDRLECRIPDAKPTFEHDGAVVQLRTLQSREHFEVCKHSQPQAGNLLEFLLGRVSRNYRLYITDVKAPACIANPYAERRESRRVRILPCLQDPRQPDLWSRLDRRSNLGILCFYS